MAALEQFAVRAVTVPFVDMGRSWRGWDCWGLLVVAYRELYGITIPDNTISCMATREIAKEVKGHPTWEEWREIKAGREMPGDVVLSRPWHVGIVLGHGRLLHVIPDVGTCIIRYQDNAWRKRILGYYRYAGPGAR